MIEIAEALKTAESEEALKAVLMESGKVREMVKAYEELTGREYSGRTVAISRSDLAENIVAEIKHVGEEESFKAL